MVLREEGVLQGKDDRHIVAKLARVGLDTTECLTPPLAQASLDVKLDGRVIREDAPVQPPPRLWPDLER